MTHREWIITCLNLHTLLTAASPGQEGTKGLTTLLSHSLGCQIRDLPLLFGSAFCLAAAHSSPDAPYQYIYAYLLKHYIYLDTHTESNNIHTLISMVSTWFAYVRCVTSVRRIMSHVRERAGIATSWWKLLLHLPKAYGPKRWREREGSGDFSVDFSEIMLLPFLWLLLFLRNWQCLLGNRACILHPKISHRPVYHSSLGGKYIFCHCSWHLGTAAHTTWLSDLTSWVWLSENRTWFSPEHLPSDVFFFLFVKCYPERSSMSKCFQHSYSLIQLFSVGLVETGRWK